MQRHAYLILAHANPAYLQTLASFLDNADGDIYIHWDAKSGSVPQISASCSKVCFTKERVRVFWGDFSVVEAEYALFREARRNGPYLYYHLISGADLPIKSPAEIHWQCEKEPDVEYIGYASASDNEIRKRVRYYYLFPHRFNSKNVIVKSLRKAFNIMQDVFRIRKQEGVFKKGSQWASVTEPFVDYLLDNEAFVRRVFKRTYCSDELYKQTLCWNSGFRDRLPETDDEFEACRRFIKWDNGELLELTQEDVPAMLNSNRWFARKFNPGHVAIINQIQLSLNSYEHTDIHH